MRTTLFLLSILACCWLIYSCNTGKEALEPKTVIPVSGFQDNIIDLSDFVSSSRNIELLPKGDMPMAPIIDFDLRDSMLYTLGVDGTISIFSAKTGKVLASKNHIGHGQGEFIEPTIIKHDGKYINVLDFKQKTIFSFNDRLNFVKKTTFDFQPLDFARVKEGYLLYNLQGKHQKGNVVLTDNEGKRLESYTLNNKKIEFALSNKVFSQNGSDIYFVEPMQNDIYHWTEGNIEKTATIDFDEGEGKTVRWSDPLQDHRSHLKSTVICGKYIISQFTAPDKFVYTNVFDQEKTSSKTGLVSTHSQYPFLPMKAQGTTLYGITESVSAQGHYSVVLLCYKIRRI